MTRLQSIGHTTGAVIETLAQLVPLIFAMIFVRALPWILGVIANG